MGDIEILQEVRRAGFASGVGVRTCPLLGPTAMPLRSVLEEAMAAVVMIGFVGGRWNLKVEENVRAGT